MVGFSSSNTVTMEMAIRDLGRTPPEGPEDSFPTFEANPLGSMEPACDEVLNFAARKRLPPPRPYPSLALVLRTNRGDGSLVAEIPAQIRTIHHVAAGVVPDRIVYVAGGDI